MKHWSDKLTYLPCAEALTWLRAQPDAQTAWEKSKRGDWMLYHAGKLAGAPGSDARRPLVLAACECARLVLLRVKAGESRPLLAIEAAERWARGGDGAPTLQEVMRAVASPYVAAAHVSYAAADAVAHVSYFAVASPYVAAAHVSYVAGARAKTLAICADIVRKHYPKVPT